MKPISAQGMIIWIGLAVIFDIVAIIPGVGYFTGPILMASLTAYLWKKGYGVVNVRRLAVTGINLIVEMIPVIQSLPVNQIMATTAILIMANVQQRLGIPLTGKKIGSKSLNVNGIRQSEKAIAERMREETKIPANVGGTRAPRIEDTEETLAA